MKFYFSSYVSDAFTWILKLMSGKSFLPTYSIKIYVWTFAFMSCYQKILSRNKRQYNDSSKKEMTENSLWRTTATKQWKSYNQKSWQKKLQTWRESRTVTVSPHLTSFYFVLRAFQVWHNWKLLLTTWKLHSYTYSNIILLFFESTAHLSSFFL